MAKAIFLNPPFLEKFSRTQRSPGVTKSGTLYYPYWLCYAAGVLDKNGHNVKMIDAAPKDLGIEQVKSEIARDVPDILIADTSTASIENDIMVCSDIKRSFPGTLMVMVGTHVSIKAEDVLKKDASIDIVIKGEYDLVVKELAERLDEGKNWKDVKGICFADNGEVITNPPGEIIEDLDELPFASEVYKKFLDIKDYYFAAADWPMIMMITGRGCPFSCFYCLYPQTMHGRKYRFRSAENVVREFKYISENFDGIKEIVIEDDTFTANPLRVKEIARLLIEENIKIKWSCNARANLDLETMKMMKRSGCRLLIVGYESGVQDILDNMHKGLSLERAEAFTIDAHKAGLLIHGCFMLGNPGETRETISRTFAFAKKLKCDSAQFYPLFVYPGTEAYDWAKEEGFLTTEEYSLWITPTGRHNCVIDLPGLPGQELTRISEELTFKYHLRAGYFLYKMMQLFSHPGEVWRTLRSGVKYFSLLIFNFLKKGNAGE